MKPTTEQATAQSREWMPFWLAFGLGALLRLIPLLYPMPADDGVIRLSKSIEWAHSPEWYGLGGQWPPLMMYFQGMLIRSGMDALWVAYATGYLISVTTLLLVFRLSLAITGSTTVALWSMLACSVYWYHISIVNANLIENFYTALLMAFILKVYTTIGKERIHPFDIVVLFVLMALMLLSRHEARLVWLASAIYLLYIRNYRVFWIVAASGALVTAYLLTENLLLRGSLLADIESATRNFLTAMEIKGKGITLMEHLTMLRRPIIFQPSIILLGAILWGAYTTIRSVKSQFLALCCGVSLALILFSIFASPLIPFQRYFVPIFAPAMAFAGIGLTAVPFRGAATVLLAAAILVQAGHWYYSQSIWVGHRKPINLLPVRHIHPSQEALQEFVKTLPENARVYALINPHAPLDFRQAAINTRQYNLIPQLYLYQNYDQYKSKLITIPPTRNVLYRMDFVAIDRNHPESRSALLTIHHMHCKVVHENNSLIVFRVVRK